MKNRLLGYMWRNLGHCLKCMRTSFRTALLTWGVLFVAILANLNLAIPGLVAILFTGLWAAHILIFAARIACYQSYIHPNVRHQIIAKRSPILLFARAASWGFVLATLPASARRKCNCCICVAPGGFWQACCKGTAPDSVDCKCEWRENVSCYLCCE